MAKTYVVQSGDNLSRIAKEQLGDAHRWPEIYEANKEIIKDPDIIHPGMELVMPGEEESVLTEKPGVSEEARGFLSEYGLPKEKEEDKGRDFLAEYGRSEDKEDEETRSGGSFGSKQDFE